MQNNLESFPHLPAKQNGVKSIKPFVSSNYKKQSLTDITSITRRCQLSKNICVVIHVFVRFQNVCIKRQPTYDLKF